ncbi:hypothetical protein T10_3743 [Trichinella papuae]|uniref:Uncharacterized protein n=1 Tax=Trichinella papuae TaxID=268474 RepID=A0A0V1MW50_9BILA|nr:hypothetical protein T10_3743 [Trichinella papuae]
MTFTAVGMMILSCSLGSRFLYSIEHWIKSTKQERDLLELINGLKHLFESSFFVVCRSKGKRNATKPCVELLIRAMRLIVPWRKYLSDKNEHHQIEL